MAMKCADICNPCRPWRLCKLWSSKVTEEFFHQGTTEPCLFKARCHNRNCPRDTGTFWRNQELRSSFPLADPVPLFASSIEILTPKCFLQPRQCCPSSWRWADFSYSAEHSWLVELMMQEVWEYQSINISFLHVAVQRQTSQWTLSLSPQGETGSCVNSIISLCSQEVWVLIRLTAATLWQKHITAPCGYRCRWIMGARGENS